MLSWLPFIIYVWVVVGLCVAVNTGVGTALAWPIIALIKAARSVAAAAKQSVDA